MKTEKKLHSNANIYCKIWFIRIFFLFIESDHEWKSIICWSSICHNYSWEHYWVLMILIISCRYKNKKFSSFLKNLENELFSRKIEKLYFYCFIKMKWQLSLMSSVRNEKFLENFERESIFSVSTLTQMIFVHDSMKNVADVIISRFG